MLFRSKNTGVGCHALLQGIFPTQGSNPGLIFYYCKAHPGSYSLSLGQSRMSVTYLHRSCRSYFTSDQRQRKLGSKSQPSPSPTATAAKSFQSCPTLCDPIDGSPPRKGKLGPEKIWAPVLLHQLMFLSHQQN